MSSHGASRCLQALLASRLEPSAVPPLLRRLAKEHGHALPELYAVQEQACVPAACLRLYMHTRTPSLSMVA